MSISSIHRETIDRLVGGDHEAFHMVFKMMYAKVHAFALGFLKNESDADEIVQTVFFKLWMKREKLADVKNLDSYLYTIAKNTVLNHLASRKKVDIDISEIKHLRAFGASPSEQVEADDLKLLIDMVVENMPPQRQKIYRMSREEGLANEEIAQKTGLQKKTVENHLNLALGDIRKVLKILIFYGCIGYEVVLKGLLNNHIG